MRPLPKDVDWTPYAYLFYFLYPLMLPFFFPSAPWEKAAAVGATLLSLPIYFAAYWLCGRRVLWCIGWFMIIGTLLAKTNPGASVYFVYAVSFLGKAFEQNTAFKWLAGLLALMGAEAWALRWNAGTWIPSIVISALIGSVVIQQMHRRRLDRALIRAQGEVEHLAKVAERERIARDLHDLLGHTLSVIVLKSELASRLAATDTPRAIDEIRDVERISREALQEVRAAVRGYRSTGIASEFRQAQQTLETAGIQVDAKLTAPPLTPSQENVVALALREAVTNVVRHAHASACRLSLQQSGGWFELEVADNGRGGVAEEGSGLRGMRERVEALGGAMERDSSAGTLLRIRVPV